MQYNIYYYIAIVSLYRCIVKAAVRELHEHIKSNSTPQRLNQRTNLLGLRIANWELLLSIENWNLKLPIASKFLRMTFSYLRCIIYAQTGNYDTIAASGISLVVLSMTVYYISSPYTSLPVPYTYALTICTYMFLANMNDYYHLWDLSLMVTSSL